MAINISSAKSLASASVSIIAVVEGIDERQHERGRDTGSHVRENDLEERRPFRTSETPCRLLDGKVELFHCGADYADHIRKCYHKVSCQKSRKYRDPECQDQALVHNKADYNSRNDGRGKEDGL